MTAAGPADRISVNTYLLRRLRVAAMVEELSAHGLSALTVHVSQLQADPDGLAALRRSRVTVRCLVAPNSADLADAASRTATADELCRALDLAASIGAPLVYTTSGSAIGMSWDDAVAAAAAVLEPAVEHAGELRIGFLIENTTPMRPEFGFSHTMADTVELARRAGCGMVADLGTCWNERDLPAVLTGAVDVLELVQLSDFRLGTTDITCRDVLGDGVVPLDSLLGSLAQAGYEGPIDIELNGPRVTAEGAPAAMRRAWAWLEHRLVGAV